MIETPAPARRPEREMMPADLPSSIRTCRRTIAYLLRATMRRVRASSIGTSRYASLSAELTGALVPLVVAERSPLAFYHALCTRFGVVPSGDGGEEDSRRFPVEAWLPEGRIRWDRALATMDPRHLRLVVHENPSLLATFATAPAAEGEDAVFDAFDDGPASAPPWRPVLPGALIAPRSYRTVWTTMAPLAHGADEKSGNVTLFRRHRIVDARTGAHAYVPFLAGNAVRGLWRDMVMGRWLRLLGLTPQEIPAVRAHELLSGGSVEKGADGATVKLDVRRRARAMCPPWDLLGGCTDGQIMQGRARVHDAILVCRETVWMVRPVLAPEMDLDAFAAALPEAAECTTLRLGTRHAHRDIPGSDGAQMLWNTEHVLAGQQFVHSLQLWGLDGVSPVTAACLADLLEDFRAIGVVGAQASRGFGLVAFDPYQPGPGTPPLPPAGLYVEHVAAHRDEMIEWAMMRGEDTPHAKAPPKPPKGKRGKASDAGAGDAQP